MQTYIEWRYRGFIKYCDSTCLVFYLPGVCTHTDTEGKQRKARVRNILKSSEKTQYLMNTLYFTCCVQSCLWLQVESLFLKVLVLQFVFFFNFRF